MLLVMAEHRLQGAPNSPTLHLKEGRGGSRTLRRGGKPALCFPRGWALRFTSCIQVFSLPPGWCSGPSGSPPGPGGHRVFQVSWGFGERWTLSLSLNLCRYHGEGRGPQKSMKRRALGGTVWPLSRPAVSIAKGVQAANRYSGGLRPEFQPLEDEEQAPAGLLGTQVTRLAPPR